MPGHDAFRHAWSAHHRFASVDALAMAMDGGSLEYLPLRAGPYDTSLTLLGLGEAVIQRVADQPRIVRGVIDPARAGFVMALAASGPVPFNGRQVPLGEAVVFTPGSEIHNLAPIALDWVSLTLPAARVAELFDLGGLHSPPGADGACGLHLPSAAVLPLQGVLRALTDQVRAAPGPGFAAAVAPGFADLSAAAFARAEHQAPPPRAARHARRIYADAIAYLDAHVAEPVYAAEVAEATGSSLRGLHKAFLAMTGLSPMAYLRRRRLMQVHAALRRGGPGRMLVKSAALEHGFWHLGRFAQQYRALFGCTPLETLARAEGGRSY